MAKAAMIASFAPFTGRRWRQPDEGQRQRLKLKRPRARGEPNPERKSAGLAKHDKRCRPKRDAAERKLASSPAALPAINKVSSARKSGACDGYAGTAKPLMFHPYLGGGDHECAPNVEGNKYEAVDDVGVKEFDKGSMS
ncbi:MULTISPECIES: hypothetical protein [unclassified Mesorhizobium]|uniref:hypothetical protein n=1 Tax=unclassified Mesorhizobium TaxID=325217 RepID=UPI0015E31F1D|nr:MULTISPECIES: hypothetical protein [unclassified Mesorhizobium]